MLKKEWENGREARQINIQASIRIVREEKEAFAKEKKEKRVNRALSKEKAHKERRERKARKKGIET